MAKGEDYFADAVPGTPSWEEARRLTEAGKRQQALYLRQEREARRAVKKRPKK